MSLFGRIGSALGGGAIGSILYNQKSQRDKHKGMNRVQRMAAEASARGGSAEDEYWNRIKSFDPMESARASSMASFEDFREGLGEDITSLRGNQVGRGRLDTGFGMEDEDRLVRGGLRDLNREIARNSMQGAQMQMGVNRDIGDYGERVTGRGVDLLMSEKDRKAQEKASKRAMWGQLGGAVLGTAGKALAGGGGG